MRIIKSRPALALLSLLAALAMSTGVGAAAQGPQVHVAPEIKLAEGKPQPFRIAVSPDGSIPAGGWIAILTLDAPLTFSSGAAYTDKGWRLSFSELDGLTVSARSASKGQWTIVVGLMDEEGQVIASASSLIAMEASAEAAPPAPAPEAPSPPPPVPPVKAEGSQLSRLEGEGSPTEARPPADQRSPEVEVRQLAEKTEEPAAVQERVASLLSAATRLLSRGEQQLGQGNIAVAREFFKRAAEMGLPEAALGMGDTFDVTELARHGVVGIRPDPGEARRWYEKARDLGAVTAATQRLDRLMAKR